jgi:hypothetical protein
MVDRKAFWNLLVGLRCKVLKLLSDMNCVILLLYSCKYITTKVLPLSAFMIVALLTLSLVLMQRRICCSCFACKLLWLCSGWYGRNNCRLASSLINFLVNSCVRHYFIHTILLTYTIGMDPNNFNLYF